MGAPLKVKAAVARAHGAPLALEGLDLGDPRADEILVRLVASGVTAADLAAIDGRIDVPLPFVPGCEGAGIVERVGADVDDIEAGDAVLVGFDCCGRCVACASGDPDACASFADLNLSGRRSDGSSSFVPSPDVGDVNGCFLGQSSFATHLLCRSASAFKVDSAAPLELLAALCHDALRAAGIVLRGFDLQPDDSLLIIGADAAGLAALMVAKALNAALIVVVDPSEARRQRAEALGATATVHDPAKAADVVMSLAASGVRFALDTTGEDAARHACRDAVADGGLCAYATPDGAAPIRLVGKDETSATARGDLARAAIVARLVEMQADGLLPLAQIVDFFPFEHVNDALTALRADAVAKPVLRFALGGFGDLDRALQEGAANDVPEPVDTNAPAPVVGKDDLVSS